jgi:hypothetical protein
MLWAAAHLLSNDVMAVPDEAEWRQLRRSGASTGKVCAWPRTPGLGRSRSHAGRTPAAFATDSRYHGITGCGQHLVCLRRLSRRVLALMMEAPRAAVDRVAERKIPQDVSNTLYGLARMSAVSDREVDMPPSMHAKLSSALVREAAGMFGQQVANIDDIIWALGQLR